MGEHMVIQINAFKPLMMHDYILHYTDGMNEIKYGAYRTAMKLRAIQKTTKCE